MTGISRLASALAFLAGFAPAAARGSTNGAQPATVRAPAMPAIPGTWKVSFEDNFDGQILDSTKWKVAQHWGGINGGAQPHPENMWVKGGSLVFKWDKKKQPFTFGAKKNRIYGTGEVTTYKRFHQKYGYIECRMRYEVQRNCWPAFWTMPVTRPTSKVNEMKWGYLKFPLRNAPRKAQRATLHLKVKSTRNGAWFDVFRGLDDSWSQSTLTWKNKPAFDAIFIAHVNPCAPAGQWVKVDVTEFVTQELAGDKTATFVVADVLQQQIMTSFHSSEAEDANRPYLDIDGRKIVAAHDAHVYAAQPDTNFGADKTIDILDTYGYVVHTGGTGMEIDILETLGIWGPARLIHALHWDGYKKNHKKKGYTVKNLEGLDLSTWTTIGLYWEEKRLEFYVNGTNTWTYTNPRVCSAPSFLILSGQTGGWAGNAKKREIHFDPSLPKHMYFDYVKVWTGTRAN